MAFKEIFSVTWVFEWWFNFLMSSILHILPLIYSIFTCVDPDPYSEYGSTKVLNTDSFWIWIHNTGKNYIWNGLLTKSTGCVTRFMGCVRCDTCIVGSCSVEYLNRRDRLAVLLQQLTELPAQGAPSCVRTATVIIMKQ